MSMQRMIFGDAVGWPGICACNIAAVLKIALSAMIMNLKHRVLLKIKYGEKNNSKDGLIMWIFHTLLWE